MSRWCRRRRAAQRLLGPSPRGARGPRGLGGPGSTARCAGVPPPGDLAGARGADGSWRRLALAAWLRRGAVGSVSPPLPSASAPRFRPGRGQPPRQLLPPPRPQHRPDVAHPRLWCVAPAARLPRGRPGALGPAGRPPSLRGLTSLRCPTVLWSSQSPARPPWREQPLDCAGPGSGLGPGGLGGARCARFSCWARVSSVCLRSWAGDCPAFAGLGGRSF